MLTNVSRRGFLAGTASVAALGASGLAAPAIAQGALTPVKFTLPFVAQGATAFAFVARERGFFRARGLDVDIALGTGSPPAAQAISAGQFDIGLVSAAATIQQAARGLNLVAVGTMMYDATMAVAVPADSPIRTAKDLEGKRLGANPRGLDFAFWPAYARLANVNTAGITVQQLDPNVLERALSQRQIDAVTCVAASSLPTFQSLNFPVRFLMWKDSGLNFYHNTVVTRPEVVAQRPQLVQGVVDALGEAMSLTLREPDAALEAFVRQRPEIGMSDQTRNSARLGQGLMGVTVAQDEAIGNGIGFADMAKVDKMIDVVMEFSVQDGRRPVTDQLYTNRFAGNIKLSAADWAAVRARKAPFAQLLG